MARGVMKFRQGDRQEQEIVADVAGGEPIGLTFFLFESPWTYTHRFSLDEFRRYSAWTNAVLAAAEKEQRKR